MEPSRVDGVEAPRHVKKRRSHTRRAGGQNALMLCADFLHVPLIDLLLSETEISIESKNVDGETALHYAALRGSMEAVEALLEFGADSASVSERFRTSTLGRWRRRDAVGVAVRASTRPVREPRRFRDAVGRHRRQRQLRVVCQRHAPETSLPATTNRFSAQALRLRLQQKTFSVCHPGGRGVDGDHFTIGGGEAEEGRGVREIEEAGSGREEQER